MERRKSEELTDVLRRFMREAGLETPLNEYRILASWGKVAGEQVQKFTTETFIRNQTLYVRLSSPALKSNLMMRRKELAEALNHEVGAYVITDITFI